MWWRLLSLPVVLLEGKAFLIIKFSINKFLFFFSQFESLTTNTSYFSISDPKGKVVTRYSREMTLINGDGCDLTKKKVSFFLFFK